MEEQTQEDPHTLAMSGEKGRALASLAAQGERPSGTGTLARLREIFPKRRDPTPNCDLPPIDKDAVAHAAGQEAVKALRSPPSSLPRA